MTNYDTAQTQTFLDRSRWGSGPWDTEPDRVSWTDEATGRPCLLRRGGGGGWCGYVAVDPGHPLHGKDYDDEATYHLEVHGGLTFANSCDEGNPEQGICHVPEPGRPGDVWWFGFDTAHIGDLYPESYRNIPADYDTYKNMAYVRAECEELAHQLVAIT